MAGPLCDAVTGQDNGQTTLEYLERANLFIVPLDNDRRWYRYHHLFADLLRRRLRQTHSDATPQLHLRASEWYEQNGHADPATDHAFEAGDFERAAKLIEEQADFLWLQGGHVKLRRWLDQSPCDVIFARPRLCIYRSWHLFVGGYQNDAESHLEVAEQALDDCAALNDGPQAPDHDTASDTDRLTLKGIISVMRAFMATYLGDVQGIIQHASSALEYLPEHDLAWRSSAAICLGDAHAFRGDMASAYRARLEAAEASTAAGDSYFSMLAYLKLAITLREQGELMLTRDMCQHQLQLAGERGWSQSTAAGGFLAVMGEVLAELGDLNRAIDLANQGVKLAERGGETTVLGWCYLCLIRILFSLGDAAGAEAIVQKIERTSRAARVAPWITSQMLVWQARLWLAQDNLEAVSRWVNDRELVAVSHPEPSSVLDYFSLTDQLLLARILITQGRLDEATALLPRLLEAAEAGDRRTLEIEILNLQALAFEADGDRRRAMSALKRALALAEPAGFFRIFVDEGAPMARLLYEAASRGIAPDYTRRLLAAFSGEEPKQPDSTQMQGEFELIEPLSEREREVLELVAQGLTNQEIASKLFLSQNTIKAHTRNIYGKLDVNSRTQAAARARALGILPPT